MIDPIINFRTVIPLILIFIGIICVPATAQKNDEVLRSYEQALVKNSGDLGIRYKLASAYYERGFYRRAIEQYREIAKLAPKDMASYYNIGLIYYHQLNFAQALDAFNQAHLLKKQDDNILYVMGMCHLALENYAQAITAMDMAIVLNPENIDAQINLANSYANSSQYKKAVTLYREILQQVGRDEFVRKNFGSALYNAGLEYFLQEEYDAALIYLKESFTYMSDRHKAHLLAANSEFNMERFPEAIILYNLVIENDEKNIDAHYYLAYSYLMIDSLIMAQREFDKVLMLDSTHSKALKFKAELLDENFSRTIEKVILAYQKEDYVTSWLQLRIAEEMVSENENVRKYRALLQKKIDTIIINASQEGDVRYQSEKYEECLVYYRQVLNLDPMQFEVQTRYDSTLIIFEKRLQPVYLKADTALQNECFYDAVAGYAKVASVLPQYRHVKKRLREAHALLDRETNLVLKSATDHFLKKEYRQTVEMYDELARIHPDFKDTSGCIKKAYDTYNAIIDKKQAHIINLLKKGKSNSGAGRYWEAQENFTQLLKIAPHHNEAQELYALAEQGISRQIEITLKAGFESFRAQKFMTANSYFRKVLKLSPKNSEALRYGRICRAILLAREASTYATQKKFTQALKLYRKARDLDRSNTMVKDGIARTIAARDAEIARLLIVGDAFVKNRHFREAEKSYQRILEKVSPKNFEVQGRLQQLAQKRKGVDVQGNVDALYSNGVGFYTRGEYIKAVSAWQKVLAIDPDHEKAQRNIMNARRKLDFMKN